MQDAPNQTVAAFGWPRSLVKDYGPWVVLARPAQPTLGSLVLATTEEALAFSSLSDEAFAALPRAVRDIEAALARSFAYDKINYLMLMMHDPHVHWHVIPRYAESRQFDGRIHTDPGWPRVPALAEAITLDDDGLTGLVQHLKEHWPD